MKGKKILEENNKNNRNYNRKKDIIKTNEKIEPLEKEKKKSYHFSEIKNNEHASHNEITKAEVVKEANRVNGFSTFFTKNKQSIYSSLITLALCLLVFGIFYNFYVKNLVIETTKLVKDVTVTDKGIADAVEKVYDSVVVVETYVKDRAYSSGTGFVFKTDDKYGYIITNYHVIDNASSVKVTLRCLHYL